MKNDTAKRRAKGREVEDAQVAAGASTIKLIKTKGKVEGIHSIGSFMSKEHGIASDQLYLLSQAVTPAKIQGREGLVVRVFDPAASKTKGVQVQDFDSLNEHPELILYEGYCLGFRRGIPDEIHIEKRTGTGPSLLEQKLQDGSITEVGMTKAPSTAMKWLRRFGNFLMMGGFMLVIFLIVGIVIAVSILTKGC